jgi:hypothetical protein
MLLNYQEHQKQIINHPISFHRFLIRIKNLKLFRIWYLINQNIHNFLKNYNIKMIKYQEYLTNNLQSKIMADMVMIRNLVFIKLNKNHQKMKYNFINNKLIK